MNNLIAFNGGGVNPCWMAGAGAMLSLLGGPVTATVYAFAVGPMMIAKCW